VNLRVCLGIAAISLGLSATAHAQQLTDVLVDGNYAVLGGETITATAPVTTGYAPVNDQVAFVYDPEFHFFMRGYYTDPAYDRRDTYRNVGYVVVAAAGDPGGYYRTPPAWLTHEAFSTTYGDGAVSLSYRYGATYVPTRRGFQSFIVYANVERTDTAASLPIYDDALTFGRGNYLLTGDGPEQVSWLDLGATGAAAGTSAIEIRTTADGGGSHWKLMLFANGAAAGYDGVDLSAYRTLVFHARANRDVVLQGGFGTADDSGAVSFPALAVGTAYRRFEIDLSAVDRSDVNTPFWIFLHKALNPVDFTDLAVWIDGIELVAAP
jgi:hypothetical protein